MNRKHHNHTPQTNPQHLKVELQNTDYHLTSGRQLSKATSSLFPHQVDYKTRRTRSNDEQTRTKTQNPHKQLERELTITQLQQIYRLRTDNSLLSHSGRLYTSYWYKIFAKNMVLLKHKKYVARLKASNSCNVSSKRNNLIKLTHYDDTK